MHQSPILILISVNVLSDRGSLEIDVMQLQLQSILCLRPQVVYELPTSSQWCFDIQWCPRNPAVLSAASFDGHIDIYSIMGGTNQAQSQRHADQVRGAVVVTRCSEEMIQFSLACRTQHAASSQINSPKVR